MHHLRNKVSEAERRMISEAKRSELGRQIRRKAFMRFDMGTARFLRRDEIDAIPLPKER